MKIRVLLVDDEEEFIDSLSQRLELREFDVKTSTSGDEALSLLHKEAFDVIILDVLMPQKDGITTLKEIKEMDPLAQVIMLTGNATVETAIEGMKLGAYDYLMKPPETEELVKKISGAYNLKREHNERIRQAEIQNIVIRKGW